jgi:DNA-binding CsgD family transcriptional regulator
MGDLAAEVAMLVYVRATKGYYTSARWYRLLLFKAVRRYWGNPHTPRNAEALAMDVDEARELVDNLRVDDRALCLARLQAVYPTLTALQQEALSLYLQGYDTTESGRAMGRNPATCHAARRRAIQRIDNPGQFTRTASCALVGQLRCAECNERGHNTRYCPRRRQGRRAA